MHGAVGIQRRFFLGKSFAVVWWAFALIATGSAILFWVVTMAYHGTIIDPAPVVFRMLLTVAAYPLLTWLFARTQHAVVR